MTNAGRRLHGTLVAGALALAVAGCSSSGGGAMADLLTLVPAGDDFAISFGDLEAHREVVGVEAPPEDASQDQLDDHLATLLPRDDPRALAARGMGWTERRGVSMELLPLARSDAYVWEGRVGAEAYVGDFDEGTFAQLDSDDVELAVEDGTVTIATSGDAMTRALAAQREEAESLADVPAAAAVVSVLDELDVIHGSAGGYADGSIPIAAAATGVAVDPDGEGSWLLVVAHYPREDGDLDDVTESLADIAAIFADADDAEVLEVEPRGDVATATIRVDDANTWWQLFARFDPLVTGDMRL